MAQAAQHVPQPAYPLGRAAHIAEREARSPRRDAWLRLRRNRATVPALVVIIVIATCAIAADWIAPIPFAQQDSNRAFEGPSSQHWLGTDQLGRDVFSRLLQGARISLAVGVVTQLIILVIGVPVGAVAGFLGGRADQLLMRAIDVMYSFPDLLIVIIVMTTLRAAFRDPRSSGLMSALANLDGAFGGLLGVFVALALVSWLTVARLVRSQVLALRERDFVTAARAGGATSRSIIVRHLLPNTVGVIVIAATFGIPRAILVEASLSFIGLGVQAPMTSWGLMLLEGYKALRATPHLILSPALALSLTVLAYNFLGDGLRDALDPWSEQTHL
ncbi:MAG TPA: ABC transporter permease [Chloroflexota bacterium]|nr:ABC transporter permease [Chloroflexota bacterium]